MKAEMRGKRWKKGEEKPEERKGGRKEKIQYAYSWYKVATAHASIIKPLPLSLGLRQLVSGMIMYSSSSTHRILLKSLSRLLKGEVEIMVGDVWDEGWGAVFC